MKKLSYLFIAIAILLSNIMCSVVAFNYRDMLCGIEHLGYSAPARLRFFLLFRLALELLYVLLWHTLFIRSPNKRLYTKAEAPPERMEPDFMSPNE
ncbi:MAG: hypothetical protein ACLRZH_00945 [Ruthenibacterium lactatiformans]